MEETKEDRITSLILSIRQNAEEIGALKAFNAVYEQEIEELLST